MNISPRQKTILSISCGAHIIQDGLHAALYLLLPIFAQTFGLSFAQVGMLRAAKSAVATLLEMPSGLLAEKFGERKLLVFGLLCAGVAYLVLAFATGIWIVLLGIVILGIGNAFQHALSSAIISNNFEATQRRVALGIYNSSGDAGKLVSTGLLGLALGIGLAWQNVAILFGLATLFFAVVLWAVLRKVSAGDSRATPPIPDENKGTGSWGIQNRTGLISLCLTVLMDTAVQSGFLVFLAFVMIDKGVQGSLTALALVLTLVGGMFGKAGCGYLAQRFGVRTSFVAIQCATALGIVILIVSAPIVAFLILPLLGMFLQGSTTITYGSIADVIHSEKQSRGFAIIYSVSSLAAIIGPIVFGIISDNAGLNTALLAMALVSLLAIPPSLFLQVDKSRKKPA